jgi:hypothetical protein
MKSDLLRSSEKGLAANADQTVVGLFWRLELSFYQHVWHTLYMLLRVGLFLTHTMSLLVYSTSLWYIYIIYVYIY